MFDSHLLVFRIGHKMNEQWTNEKPKNGRIFVIARSSRFQKDINNFHPSNIVKSEYSYKFW